MSNNLDVCEVKHKFSIDFYVWKFTFDQDTRLNQKKKKKNPNFCSTIIYEFHMKNASYTQKSVIDQASNWSLKIPIVLICTNYILIAINGPDKRQNDDLIEENRSFYS